MTDVVRDFVNAMVNTAEDIAIFECGNPDEETLARLRALRITLQGQLAPLLGAEMAGRMIEVFCAAVMGEKHERETLAAMGFFPS